MPYMRACASGKCAAGAQCCLRVPQQLGRAAWNEYACALVGGLRKTGALFYEFGVVMVRLFREAVFFLSACRSLQMPGGRSSFNTIRRRSTLRNGAEAWCGGGTGREIYLGTSPNVAKREEHSGNILDSEEP